MTPKLPKRSVIVWYSPRVIPKDGQWLLLRHSYAPGDVTVGHYGENRFHALSTATLTVLRWAYLPK